MKRLTDSIAGGVMRWPVAIVVVALVLTGVFAFFSTQQELAQGAESFAPDTPEFDALVTINEEFSGASEETLQVIFDTDGGDVVTADGLRSYVNAIEAIRGSDLAALLADRPGGDIVGFMDPVLVGLEMKAQELGIPFETIVASITDDQVKDAYLQALAQLPPEYAAQAAGTLSSDADLETPEATAGLMIVFANVSTLDDPETELMELEVAVADDLASAGSGDVEVRPFSISLLFSSASEFEDEVGRLFAIAFLVIVLILGFVYWMKPGNGYGILGSLRRSAADTLLTLVAIIAAILWMNGIGVLLGPDYLGLIGHFNAMLQILPVLLIGLGVDYAIHLNSRYREELGEGATVTNSAGRAISTVGIALALATATTAVGFLTNIVNPVGALKDFGILAAIGIAAAFVLMMTFLPAFRLLLDRRAERRGALPRDAFAVHSDRLLPKYMGKVAVLAEHIPAVTLAVAVLLGGLGAYGLARLDTTFDFTDFLPEENEHVVTLGLLTDKFGGGFEQTDVLAEGDVATPAVHNALVESLGSVATVPNVATFGGHALAESPISVIARLATPPDLGGDEALFDPDFAQIAIAAGLQPDLTVSATADVGAIYDAALATSPGAMGRVVAQRDGVYTWTFTSITTTADDDHLIALADDLNAAFTPVEEAGASSIATSQAILGLKVVTALQGSQIWALSITLIAATLLLMIAFYFEVRRPFLGIITMAPVALVVLWVFGVMAARGISFNVVTAMIANLAIGIGVPYSIHITYRYLEDRHIHDSPEEAVRETTTHTGGALAGSALTTAAGFGVLITSTLKPFQQFGEVTFWAILFALIASVLVLPSILVLWDNWHRRRGETLVDEEAYHKAFDASDVIADS